MAPAPHKGLDDSLTRRLPQASFPTMEVKSSAFVSTAASQDQQVSRRTYSGKLRNFKVLGDYAEFEEKLNATTPPKPPPTPETTSTVNPAEFPPDVWQAATISPDGGAAIIRCYREAVKTREHYLSQLSNIHEARRMKQSLATAMALPAAGAARGGMAAPLPPISSVGTLPPLTNTLSASGPMKKTVSDMIHSTAELRKLDRFELQNVTWDRLTDELAQRTQRPAFDLAMQRGPEFRKRVEVLEALERAMPIEDRLGGPDTWSMSLRNAWERIVPLGNMFSGLFVTIKDQPGGGKPGQTTKQLEKIGRPLEPEVDMLAETKTIMGNTMGKSLQMRGRDFLQGEALQDRTQRYASQLRRNYPYNPDLKALALKGEALESQLEALAYAPITVGEVEHIMETSEPEAYQAYMAVKQQQDEERLAAEAAERERLAAEAAAAAAAGPHPGPHLEVSASRLLMRAVAGQEDSLTFTLAHKGTTAIYYTWKRQASPTLPFSSASAAAADVLGAAPKFFLAKQSGVLLPNHTHEFPVTFSSSAPGVFTETWALHTSPPLDPACGEVTVTFRGMAVAEDTSSVARTSLADDLNQREKMRKVHAALERILHDVHLPERPPPAESEQEAAQAEAFDRANISLWPPVYYPGPAEYSALADIYTRARALHIEATAPPPVDETDKNKKKAPAKKGVVEAPAAPPPPPKYDETWDASLASIQTVIDDVKELRAQEAESLQQQLAAAIASLATPPDIGGQRSLLRHATRAALLRAADAVAGKLETVHADYEERLAAQQAKEEEGGPAAAAAPGAVVVGPQWLADKSKAGAKAQLKNLVPWMFEELGREKSAVGDYLEARVREVDAAMAALEGGVPAQPVQEAMEVPAAAAGEGSAAEAADAEAPAAAVPAFPAGLAGLSMKELYWMKFSLLRSWVRLGIPPRGDIH